jgi:hypothetical protein
LLTGFSVYLTAVAGEFPYNPPNIVSYFPDRVTGNSSLFSIPDLGVSIRPMAKPAAIPTIKPIANLKSEFESVISHFPTFSNNILHHDIIFGKPQTGT